MGASLDISFLTVQVLSALRQAAFLFLISSGLTLVFGVLNILNFAHGSLYMLGAYFIYYLATQVMGVGGFLAVLIAAPLGVALVGAVIEIGLLRRIYRQEEIYQLLLTYSLVLIIDDVAKIVFGPEFKSIPKPEILSGSFTLFGGTVPVYTLLVLIFAPAVALGLWYILYRTSASTWRPSSRWCSPSGRCWPASAERWPVRSGRFSRGWGTRSSSSRSWWWSSAGWGTCGGPSSGRC
jgi:branched-subunit amino acid ABC-type transport system permease component